jgi:hypothetical protein
MDWRYGSSSRVLVPWNSMVPVSCLFMAACHVHQAAWESAFSSSCTFPTLLLVPTCVLPAAHMSIATLLLGPGCYLFTLETP